MVARSTSFGHPQIVETSDEAADTEHVVGTRRMTQYVLWRRGGLNTLIIFKVVALVATLALKAVRVTVTCFYHTYVFSKCGVCV